MNLIDNYLKDVTPSQKEALVRIRTIIKETVPSAEEVFSWGMPTYKYNGKNLIHFAAFKEHMSLFPGALPDTKEMQEKLKTYKTSKGTIQFTEENPLPESLIKELIQNRIDEIDKR